MTDSALLTVGAILVMTALDTGLVATAALGVLALMGAGMIWQGIKNLKRDKK